MSYHGDNNKFCEIYTNVCLEIAGHITKDKLRQMKFLLYDLTSGFSIHDNKTFLDLIQKLENENKLNKDTPGQNEAFLVAEILDAVSLNNVADKVRVKFEVQGGPSKEKITSLRKLLVKLSNEFEGDQVIQRMNEFLQECVAPDTVIFPKEKICALDIFQALFEHCIISPKQLSKLKELMQYCSKKHLIEHIDKFIENGGSFVKASYGLRNLPRNMIKRPEKVEDIIHLLKTVEGNRMGDVAGQSISIVGIRGMGGLGKTILALDVAWTVSHTRQVIWLDVGQNPDCLTLVNTLIKTLGGTESFSNINTAQTWLRNNPVNESTLVVLDDVWNVEYVNVFDSLSGKCQMLITARDAEVLHGLICSSVYDLKHMTKDESRSLLYLTAHVEPNEKFLSGTNMQQIVEELLDQCRNLPLALTLVGSILIDSKSEEDWQDVLDDFKNADLEKLRSNFSKDRYPHDNLLKAMLVSFERLEELEKEKFLDFAIFPEDTDLPSDILIMFWKEEPEEDENRKVLDSDRKGRDILRSLEKKSLLQKGSTQNSFRIHDVLMDFAKAKLGKRFKHVQKSFLKILRRRCENREWDKFIGNKKYFFNFLPFHLNSAQMWEELLRLFFDFHWLYQKVKQTNMPSLISDFRFIGNESYDIKLLKSSLMLSADVMEKNPDFIGPQLLGRLLPYVNHNQRIHELLENVRKTCLHKNCLLPLFSCLSEPVGPLLRIQTNINDGVFSLVTKISSTGTLVISALANKLIKIFELETGKELKVLKGHDMSVCCLALSHGGTILASGSTDTKVKLWNMDVYAEIHDLSGEGGFVNALDFSTDDVYLYSGSNDGKLRVWHVHTGRLHMTIDAHADQIRGLCSTTDENYIATASYDKTIKLWSTDNFQCPKERVLKGHLDIVYCVICVAQPTIEGEKHFLVSASGDKTIKIWDLDNFNEIRTLKGHQAEIYNIAISSDAKHIVSGGADKIMRLWCFETGKLLFNFKGHSQSIRSVKISPDGKKALSGSQDKSFRVWDLEANLKEERSRGHSQDVIHIAVTLDGSFCVSASMDGNFKVWDCRNGKELFTLKGKKRRAVYVKISPNDRRCASIGKDSTSSIIQLWDLNCGTEMSCLEVENNTPEVLCFNSDGKKIIIGCKNDQILIWSWENFNNAVHSITMPVFTTTSVVCHKEKIYTCSRNMEVCQIDLSSLTPRLTCQGPSPKWTSMGFLPNAEAVLCGNQSNSSFIYWETSTKREINHFAGHPEESMVTAIDVTSDGGVLTGSSLGTISLMDLSSDSKTFQKFQSTINNAAVHLLCMLGDRTGFGSIDIDNNVEIRSCQNKERVERCQPEQKINCVTSIDKKSLLFGCNNGELLLLSFLEDGRNYEQHRHKAYSEAVTQVKRRENTSRFFVSGSARGLVNLWYVPNTNVWTRLWSHNIGSSRPISAIAFVPNAEDILIGASGSEVYQFNGSGIVKTYKYRCYGVAALQVVNDKLFAAFIHNFSIAIWSMAEDDIRKPIELHTGAGREQLSFISIERNLVVSKGSHHSIMLWDVERGTPIHRLIGHTHDIRSLCITPNGDHVLSGSRDKTVSIWNLHSGKMMEQFTFDRYVRAVAPSSTGVVTVGLEGGQVCFFNLKESSRA